MNDPAPDKYNRVFETYVDETKPGEVDLVGLIAYALYKRQKRDLIIEFYRETGRRPTDAEVFDLVRAYVNADMRLTLRGRASDLLIGYADTFTDAATPRIRENAINDTHLGRYEQLRDEIKARTSWKSQVVVGLVSSMLFAVILLALVIISLAFGSDVVELYQRLHGIGR